MSANDRAVTVMVPGKLDLTTSTAVEAEVLARCREGASEITVDLGPLSCVESRGLQALMLSRKRCMERRCRFRVVSAGATVARLFELARPQGASA